MAGFNMLDFFHSPQPDYPSAEVDRMNRELLEQLARRNEAQGSREKSELGSGTADAAKIFPALGNFNEA